MSRAPIRLFVPAVLVVSIGACRNDDSPSPGSGSRPAAVSRAADGPAAACEETCAEPAPSAAASAEDAEMFAGCQEACGTKRPYREDEVVRQPGVKMGELARCPVSRVVFEVSGATAKRQHEGHDVFFCCQPCAQRFAEDPQKFATRL